MDPAVIIKILFLSTLSFLVAFSITPILTHFLYKYKLGKNIRNDGTTPIFTKLHEHKAGTPTMGGILIWVAVLVVALLFFYLARWSNNETLNRLNFLTRSETWLPLGALIVAAIVGLFDDLVDIGKIGKSKSGGFKIKYRLMIYALIAIVGACWFYFKLDWTILHVPFFGNFDIGWWYIPFFVFVIVATSFSVNEIDGLDGLSGGTLLASFTAFGWIAALQGKYDLATLCGVVSGALLAFLWFNINPARFFMGDTGAMALGVCLGIIAMLTNSALFLPVIGLLFVVESLSVIIQLTSKKLFKKKVFLSAPIHHHFEAKGWSETKIVMRFWVISGVTAMIGIILFMLDRGM